MRRRGSGQFNLTVTAPADIGGLSLEALKSLVVQPLSKVGDQERVIADLREENARLKGLNGRPRIKPSGMENASEPKQPGKRGKRRRRGKIVPQVAIKDRVIQAQVPPGSRFKGYESFVVQDIVLRAEAIRYRRERWITPDGNDAGQFAIGRHALCWVHAERPVHKLDTFTDLHPRRIAQRASQLNRIFGGAPRVTGNGASGGGRHIEIRPPDPRHPAPSRSVQPL